MINQKNALIIIFIAVAIGMVWFYGIKDSASGDRKKALEERLTKIPFTAETLLPDDSAFAQRGSKITYHRLKRTELTDSTLTNADQYLNSLVIGLIRATYDNNGKVFYVEIAQFASGNDAYGFYSQNRPAGVPFDTIGTESYYWNDTLRFTKSNYVVTSTTQADSNRYWSSMVLAKLIDQNVKSQTVQPLFFKLFPYRGQVVPSQKYYSLNFLGIEGLDEVYTIDYAVDEDTLTLFLTVDTSGGKFIELSDWGSDFGDVTKAPEQFEFPDQFSLSFEHPQYGQIVAGMANRKLAGVLSYNRATGLELGSRWVIGLK